MQLEQQLYGTSRNLEQRQKVYVVGDLEKLSATSLYYGQGGGNSGGGNSGGGIGDGGCGYPSLKSKKGYSSIGTFSDFAKEGPENISIKYDLEEFAPEAKGYTLSERYDASGHDNSLFHLNLDLTGINSGKSNKNEDGFKGLGPAHKIDLFNKK